MIYACHTPHVAQIRFGAEAVFEAIDVGPGLRAIFSRWTRGTARLWLCGDKTADLAVPRQEFMLHWKPETIPAPQTENAMQTQPSRSGRGKHKEPRDG